MDNLPELEVRETRQDISASDSLIIFLKMENKQPID
jgi:hypothetical protein